MWIRIVWTDHKMHAHFTLTAYRIEILNFKSDEKTGEKKKTEIKIK